MAEEENKPVEVEEPSETVAENIVVEEVIQEEYVPAHVDEQRHDLHATKAAKHSPLNKLIHKTKAWLRVKKNRYILAGVGVFIVAAILTIPPLKFGILNTFGVRGSLNVQVFDDGTSLPLKDVKVTVGDQEGVTGVDGEALVEGVRLGSQVVAVEKIAYSTREEKVMIKSGTNEIDEIRLVPVGSQFTFSVVDWLSKEVIKGATISTSQNAVFSNDDGEALLTVPPVNGEDFLVTVTADGYVKKELNIDADDSKTQEVRLVVDDTHFYFSKHSGNYDLFRVGADGKEPELILEGTGKESDIHMLSMVDKRAIFIVSTREGKRNSEGTLLSGLFRVDTATGELEKLDESESLRLQGTSRNRLIYVKVASGTSGNNPERQRLISMDPVTGNTVELAASNYFNSVIATEDAVYYAPSDFYKSEKTPYLFRSNPLNGERATIHAAEVWTIYRTDYDELTFDAKQDWYSVPTDATSRPIALAGRPANIQNRLYETNPSNSKALRVDTRDGQGYLIMIDIETGEETNVHIKKGLRYPVRWIDDNHAVFRIDDSGGIADYVVDIRGGEPARIVTVSDVPSYERWYYYY